MPTLYTASLGSVVQILQGQKLQVTATDKTGNTTPDQVVTVLGNIPAVGTPTSPTLTLSFLTSTTS
jgi:hypothetical protein